jgi:hypothetical protein
LAERPICEILYLKIRTIRDTKGKTDVLEILLILSNAAHRQLKIPVPPFQLVKWQILYFKPLEKQHFIPSALLPVHKKSYRLPTGVSFSSQKRGKFKQATFF